MNIKKTKSFFQVSGEIFGLNYINSESENGEWRKIEFGLKLKEDNEILFVELFGIKTKNVKLYKVNSFNGLNFKDSLKVKWNDIHTTSGYRFLNGVKINDNLNLISYDAVQHMKKEFKNGDFVDIKGKIEFSLYNNETQIRFLINSIDKIKESDIIDKVSHFNLEAIFEKVHNENLRVRFITKKNNEFIIIQHDLIIHSEKKEEIINHFTYNVKEGELIKIYGIVQNKCLTKEMNGFTIITDYIFNQFIACSGYSLKEYYNLSILDSLHIEEQKEELTHHESFNEFGF